MAFIRTFKQGSRQYRALVKSVWNKARQRSEQHIIRWLGRSEEAATVPLSRSFREREEKFLLTVLGRRRSLLMHGAWGVGKTFLAQRVCHLLNEQGHRAHYFRWTSPVGDFLKAICQALAIETEEFDEEGDKSRRKTQAELLEEIGGTLQEEPVVLIVDKAHDIPKQLRNHIELWLENGAVILLTGTLLPRKALFLKVPRWELAPLDARQSLQLVRAAAEHFQVNLARSQHQALAGLLPDLDTPNSWPGRILRPLSLLISHWGHRQVTHSLLGSAIAALCFLPLVLLGWNWYFAANLGYGAGWLLDAASKTGVPIFWPGAKRLVFPFDAQFRLKTGSLTERLFQLVLIGLLACVWNANLSGGAVASFSNWLGSATAAVTTYHEQGNRRQVFARVTGNHRLTQQRLEQERFQVIGAASEVDLILQAADGSVYQAGRGNDANIRTDRIQLELGPPIQIAHHPIQIPKPSPVKSLMAVLQPGDRVTGELATDEASLLRSQRDLRQFQTLTVEHLDGNQATIHLKLASKSDLMALPDLWISGSVLVRRVQ